MVSNQFQVFDIMHIALLVKNKKGLSQSENRHRLKAITVAI